MTDFIFDFIFLGSKITKDSDCSHEIKRCLLLGRKAMTNPGSVLKRQKHHFVNKGPYSQSYGFSSSHLQMWELDHKKDKCRRIDGFKLWCWRRLLRVPFDSKEIKSVNPKGNPPWIFIGRTDAEAPTLWPPDVKSWLTGKDPDAQKDWRQVEKGTTEN